MTDSMQNLNAIFLLHVGRSGAFFLWSLLDNHEKILNIPCDFKYYKQWDKFEHSNKKDIRLFISNFFETSHLRTLLNGKHNRNIGYLGKNKDIIPSIDKELMQEYMLEYLGNKDLTRKNFFLSIYYSYAKIKNINLEELEYILEIEHARVKPESFADYLKRITKDFPEAKIIVTIRDPRESVSSFKRYWAKRLDDRYNLSVQFFPLAVILEQWTRIYFLKKYIPEERLKFIRFEDLHKNPKTLMREISDWLNIDYSETLLQSTLAGIQWWGNSSEGKSQTGFSQERLKPTWKKELSKWEADILEILLKENMIKFGYVLCNNCRKNAFRLFFTFTRTDFYCYLNFINFIRKLYRDIHTREETAMIDRIFKGWNRKFVLFMNFIYELFIHVLYLLFYPLIKPFYLIRYYFTSKFRTIFH